MRTIHHDRNAQLLVKAGLDLDEARLRLERSSIVITSDVAGTPWAQAAILTLARCALRSFRGGVFLGQEFKEQTCVGNWRPFPLQTHLASAGCRTNSAPAHALRVHIGCYAAPKEPRLFGWADGWNAIISPKALQKDAALGNELSGALVGAMLVSEAFRIAVLDDVLAGRRMEQLNPFGVAPDDCDKLIIRRLPSSLWLIGLGNLGQAALWTLGLLPYGNPAGVKLTLQDMDVSGEENLDTQILTDHDWIGKKKARMCARWCEDQGFTTMISEHAFTEGTLREATDPACALVGVDNLPARRAVASGAGKFNLVVDVGLGATTKEIFDIRLHSFPGLRSAQEAWPNIQARVPSSENLPPELAQLVADGRLDECGAVTIAGKAVGLPSTAIVAAVLQIGQVCRAINAGEYSDLIDISLRNTSRATFHSIGLERPELLVAQDAKNSSHGNL